MESDGPLQVTLTGDRSGDYVIVEERPEVRSSWRRTARDDPHPAHDERLRLAARSRPGQARSCQQFLARPVRTPPSISETLEGWGVELADGETPSDLMVADIDGDAGFLAITSQRFIFVAQTVKGLGVVQENLLSAARNVAVVGSRRRQKLRVTWHGTESVISLHDRDALARLESHLTGHEIS